MKRLTLIKNAHNDLGWLEFVFVNVLYQIGITRWNPRRHYLTEADHKAAQAVVAPGDVVLVGQHRRLSAFLIRGVFTHSLVYVGEGDCIHAYAQGVEKISFAELFSEYDTMAIMRVPHMTDQQQASLIAYLHERLGEPYDYWFEHTNADAWFCSELICAALQEHDVELKICAPATIPAPQSFYTPELEPVFLSRYLKIEAGELRVRKP